jgi:formate/nitrite transporter FocA (FNT family)
LIRFAAHDGPGKVLAIIFPKSAFVALGFEHSVANMYLI